MEARQVNAALSAMRSKTDKHDARGIAQILRAGWYSRVHVKSVEIHHPRALLTCRKVMQRKCIDLENEIRGLLKVFGVKLPMRLSRGAFDLAVRETIESDPARATPCCQCCRPGRCSSTPSSSSTGASGEPPTRMRSAAASWASPASARSAR
jgi:hypothetical protein